MFKNKLSKRILVLLLTLAMVLSVSACGKKATDTDKEGNNVESDGGSTPAGDATGKKTKISVYRATFNLAAPSTEDVKKVQDEINAYIGDKINVEIELNDISSTEYKDKVNLDLVAGSVDLFWTANWQETIGCDDIVKNNAVYDITELLPNYDLYGSVPEWVWQSAGYDGKNYFVPCYKESAEGYNLAFRSDLVESYGWDLSTVKSLKDIEPMLADAYADGFKYPYLTQKTAMFYRYYLDKFDFFSQDSFLAVDKDANAVVNTVVTPEFLEFATIMADWAEKGYLHEDDLTKTTNDTTTKSKDWAVTWWTDVPNNAEANSRWEQDAEMVKVTENWLQSNGTLGSCYAISSQSSEAEVDASLKFLSLLYTDQKLADLYTFGIEGTHYKMEDGKVAKIKDAGYNHSAWESTSVSILSIANDEPDDKVELYTIFNDGAKNSVANGFRFDSSTVETQYAACQQVFQEFGFVLEHGGYPLADVQKGIDDYNAALEAAGFADVLAEAQSQYADWLEVK